MATTLNITSTYSGEASSDYIAASLLSGNTIANGLIEVKPNIKFKEVLRLIALDGITANASCDFSDTSTVSLTERIIEPKQLQVNLEVCSHPFRSDWDAVSMGYSSHDTVPKNFSDYFIGLMAAKVSQKTEQDIWSGTAGAGSFDGFTTLLAADAGHTGATKITGEAVTPANVVTNLGLIVDAIPATLYGNDDLFIYVSQNIFRAYKRSLGGFQANGQGANGYMAQGNNQDIDVQFFDGVKVVACNGLADNKAIAALKSNLVFGTGLLSDQNLVKTLDMSDLDGSSNVRFIMKYSAAVQYKLVGEIVSFGLGL